MDWINDELAAYRIIVKNLEEDMFDGQIFQKLVGKYIIFKLIKFYLSSLRILFII